MPPAAGTTMGEMTTGARALQVMRDRWWIVVGTALLCSIAALAIGLSSTKQYDTSSRLLFRNSELDSALFGSSVFNPSLDPQRESSTNLSLVTSNQVAERVRRALQLRISGVELLRKVKVVSEQNADVVAVTVTDSVPTVAAAIADAFATQYVEFRQEADRRKVADAQKLLRERLRSLPASARPERRQISTALEKLVALEAVQTGNAEVIDTARVPTVPSSPRPKRDSAIALILGLALGLAIAFALDLLDRRVKSIEEFEQIYGVAALTSIPQRSFEARTAEEQARAFEPYRIVHNSLSLVSPSGEVRVVLVTSATPGEGKTSVALNLARAVALTGESVALVEADLRRPTLLQRLHLADAGGGLTTALVGRQPVRELLRDVAPGVTGFRVLPSGPQPPNPAELLRSGRMGQVIDDLLTEVRTVIIDAPPLVPVADAQVLLDYSQIDACLVIARAYHTTRAQARATRAIIAQHRFESIGLVVTGTPTAQGGYGYYGPVKDAGGGGGGARRLRFRRQESSRRAGR